MYDSAAYGVVRVSKIIVRVIIVRNVLLISGCEASL